MNKWIQGRVVLNDANVPLWDNFFMLTEGQRLVTSLCDDTISFVHCDRRTRTITMYWPDEQREVLKQDILDLCEYEVVHSQKLVNDQEQKLNPERMHAYRIGRQNGSEPCDRIPRYMSICKRPAPKDKRRMPRSVMVIEPELDPVIRIEDPASSSLPSPPLLQTFDPYLAEYISALLQTCPHSLHNEQYHVACGAQQALSFSGTRLSGFKTRLLFSHPTAAPHPVPPVAQIRYSPGPDTPAQLDRFMD